MPTSLRTLTQRATHHATAPRRALHAADRVGAPVLRHRARARQPAVRGATQHEGRCAADHARRRGGDGRASARHELPGAGRGRAAAAAHHRRGHVNARVRQVGNAAPYPTHGSFVTHPSHTCRQQGVVAFWSASPSTEAGDVHMHWPTEDASTLIFRKGESRCILIASGLGPRAHMYAHLKPCDSRV